MEYPLAGIHEPHNHDVLCGRGSKVNLHAGNKFFRSLVNKLKVKYIATQKSDKAVFAKVIVAEIRSLDPPGRFLKQNPDTGIWHDIGEKKAVHKTRQALREDAPRIEGQLEKWAFNIRTHVMVRMIAEKATYQQISGDDFLAAIILGCMKRETIYHPTANNTLTGVVVRAEVRHKGHQRYPTNGI